MNTSDAQEDGLSLEERQTPVSASSAAEGEEFVANGDVDQTKLIQFIHEFDLALIIYITTSRRLLFAEDPQTWQDFHTNSAENTHKYSDFTAEEICYEFLNEILPHIYSYDLTEKEMETFEMLELHPEYRREADGYVRLQKAERPSVCHQPQLNVDYSIVEEQPFRPDASPRRNVKEFTLKPEQERRLHTVVTKYPMQRQQGGYGFQFSEETHALLSAVLSDDLELSGCVLHEPQEIHKRLRAAKKDFEQSGKMPKNCLPAAELQAKIQKLSDLRRTLAHMMDNMFL